MSEERVATPMERQLALAIVNKLGSTGTPPEFGIEHFTVGLEPYLRVLEDEYLNGILKFNLSSFKLITGNYGGGKTHFLYTVRNLAFRHNYCVAYVGLNPTECPFDKLELVYKSIAANLIAPRPADAPTAVWDKGIESVVRKWHDDQRKLHDRTDNLRKYLETLPTTESTSFSNAARGAFASLLAEDGEGFNDVVQWLKGEDVSREVRAMHRISERIDKATAFRVLRSLIQWVHAIGYTGLVLLFDEAERGMSISSSRDKRRALDNLRQLVDECGNSRLPGAMVFYAVPDENLLLEGSGGVYEALKQRLRTTLNETNPVGVRINLEDLGIEPAEFLGRLGERLAVLFGDAYEVQLPEEKRGAIVRTLAELAASAFAFDVGYRRLFVVSVLEAFHQLRAKPTLEFGRKEAEKLLRVTTQRLEVADKEQVEKEEF
ncbi:MAG TPA: BREX system ATP-binding domain-containing protein [bacterium]|nr:BREX system ATP-binding domain-containing protein [bacterium]